MEVSNRMPASRVGLGSHLRAIVALPMMVTVGIPICVLALYDPSAFDLSQRLPAVEKHLGQAITLVTGLVALTLGVSMAMVTIKMFMLNGSGTLAPWNPTNKLVIVGVYRHVRNPMITGIGLILLGESMVLGSYPLLVWFIIYVLANLAYIPLMEEPGLEERFGRDYQEYQAHVPRWVPRRTPWRPRRDWQEDDEMTLRDVGYERQYVR